MKDSRTCSGSGSEWKGENIIGPNFLKIAKQKTAIEYGHANMARTEWKQKWNNNNNMN